MFRQFGREAALRIPSNNVPTIQAGSGFEDLFPQCSDKLLSWNIYEKFLTESRRKRLSGSFPAMFGQFGREAALRIFSHNVRTIRGGIGFEEFFYYYPKTCPLSSGNLGGKRL